YIATGGTDKKYGSGTFGEQLLKSYLNTKTSKRSAFSPDGKTPASASDDTTVQLIQLEPREVKLPEKAEKGVRVLTYLRLMVKTLAAGKHGPYDSPMDLEAGTNRVTDASGNGVTKTYFFP
ncbi:MAG: hypothetical protein IPK83_24530, partial [Planctomycetes bacterium]|nr:hypothetical protein [Planctomycetota bacterium]